MRRLRRIIHRYAPDIWDARLNSEILSVLPLECVLFEKLKSPAKYINMQNGLFNIKTFELEEHNVEVASLTQLPFEYDPKAKCPKFKRFLKDVFLEDKALIARVQEIMGYCLSPSTEAQSFFIFYSDGSSGKSVLCSLIHRLAGGDRNVSSVTLSNLKNKFQRAELYGKLINISTENETSQFDTEALKAITSGDPIQVEYKFQKPFTTRLATKLLFAVNTMPEPKDKTFAFYRRLVLVPFLAKFVDRPRKGTNELKRNPNMEVELREELQGILTWSIEGLQRLRENNYQFTKSREADKLMLEYRKDITPVFSFIEESIIPSNSQEDINTQQLYEAFVLWCEDNGVNDRMTKRLFLKTKLFERD